MGYAIALGWSRGTLACHLLAFQRSVCRIATGTRHTCGKQLKKKNMNNAIDPVVIYDIGANVGSNIPYYLKKADLVVAVEANPILADALTEKYAEAISAGRLVVGSFVLSAEKSSSAESFFVNNANPLLSQFPEPEADVRSEFTKIEVPSVSIVDLISKYGSPYYIKLDAEGYDAALLRALFSNGIKPPFISAECHDAEVFSLMVALGGYEAFKIVDGARVAQEYAQHAIEVDGGTETYSFPKHSAGPFGDDIHGPWHNRNAALEHLARVGLGWTDVHATTTQPGGADTRPSVYQEARGLLRRALKGEGR